MKIEINSPEIQTNLANKKEIKASFSDPKVIVDLLRKHYAHPIRTIVQEYLSNARDSHREAKQSRAIEITLPTKANPVFKIRDFGVGLDEEQLERNFMGYGSSTKRSSNDQTGGFGIGSKSAWVYTPTFYLKTYSGKKETLYEASIAKEYEGTLALISEKESTLDRGIEIQIPVKLSDISKFIKAFYRATFFWKEKVEVVNFKKEELENFWVEKPYLNYQDEYFVLKTDLLKIGVNSYYGNVICIDGIIYEVGDVDEDYLDNYGVNFIVKSEEYQLFIPNFKTGELKISISRENIEDNSSNNKKLEQRSSHLSDNYLTILEKSFECFLPKERIENANNKNLKKISKNFKELDDYFNMGIAYDVYKNKFLFINEGGKRYLNFDEYREGLPLVIGLDCKDKVWQNYLTGDGFHVYGETNLVHNIRENMVLIDLESIHKNFKFEKEKFECVVFKTIKDRHILEFIQAKSSSEVFAERQVKPKKSENKKNNAGKSSLFFYPQFHEKSKTNRPCPLTENFFSQKVLIDKAEVNHLKNMLCLGMDPLGFFEEYLLVVGEKKDLEEYKEGCTQTGCISYKQFINSKKYKSFLKLCEMVSSFNTIKAPKLKNQDRILILCSLRILDFKDFEVFFANEQQIKRYDVIAKQLGVKLNKKIITKLNKAIKHPLFDLVLEYLDSNDEILKKKYVKAFGF